MRKIIFIILLVVCIVVMINNRIDINKEIRVRIVPNSNSESDLLNKQTVKNITICFLSEAYDNDYNIYTNNIVNGIDYLEEVLENEVDESILISFDNHTLYNKTYNNTVVENPTELTLLVIIGNGDGDNWWGTVYPEFLLVNSTDVIKYESIFVKFFNKIKGETKND